MKYQNKDIFIVDSRKRIAGTDSNFIFSLSMNTSVKYDKTCVLAADISKTYYQVKAGYNSFTLKEGDEEIQVTVSVSTYTRDSFRSSLNVLLSNASSNNWFYTLSIPIT